MKVISHVDKKRIDFLFFFIFLVTGLLLQMMGLLLHTARLFRLDVSTSSLLQLDGDLRLMPACWCTCWEVMVVGFEVLLSVCSLVNKRNVSKDNLWECALFDHDGAALKEHRASCSLRPMLQAVWCLGFERQPWRFEEVRSSSRLHRSWGFRGTASSYHGTYLQKVISRAVVKLLGQF